MSQCAKESANLDLCIRCDPLHEGDFSMNGSAKLSRALSASKKQRLKQTSGLHPVMVMVMAAFCDAHC